MLPVLGECELLNSQLVDETAGYRQSLLNVGDAILK